jgi:predicted patatin/cPLA2 family phospholipase
VTQVHNKDVNKQYPRHINLALEGGGAHFAFTWGVLDYLMRDGHIYTDDFIKGGRQGAINSFYLFCKETSERKMMTSVSVMPWFMLGAMAGEQSHWNVENYPVS